MTLEKMHFINDVGIHSWMIKLNVLIGLVVIFTSCSSPRYTPELVANQLLGQWELDRIYKNGIMVSDTIWQTRFSSQRKNTSGEIYIVNSDAGLIEHYYNHKTNEVRIQEMERIFIHEYLFEGNELHSMHYFLDPEGENGNRRREEYRMMFPRSVFTIVTDDKLILRYEYLDIEVISLSVDQLVIKQRGKEWHLKKLRNRF